jgi:predicted aldo/keto reductase-like oxidoreductase
MPCPSGVDITGILRSFDESYMLDNYGGFNFFYNGCKNRGADASKCAACGACESACPQKIEIIEKLAKIHEKAA